MIPEKLSTPRTAAWWATELLSSVWGAKSKESPPRLCFIKKRTNGRILALHVAWRCRHDCSIADCCCSLSAAELGIKPTCPRSLLHPGFLLSIWRTEEVSGFFLTALQFRSSYFSMGQTNSCIYGMETCQRRWQQRWQNSFLTAAMAYVTDCHWGQENMKWAVESVIKSQISFGILRLSERFGHQKINLFIFPRFHEGFLMWETGKRQFQNSFSGREHSPEIQEPSFSQSSSASRRANLPERPCGRQEAQSIPAWLSGL